MAGGPISAGSACRASVMQTRYAREGHNSSSALVDLVQVEQIMPAQSRPRRSMRPRTSECGLRCGASRRDPCRKPLFDRRSGRSDPPRTYGLLNHFDEYEGKGSWGAPGATERSRQARAGSRRPDGTVFPLNLPHRTRRNAPHADLPGADDVQGCPELEARPGRPHRLGVHVDPADVVAGDHVVAGRSDRLQVVYDPG